VLRTVIQATNVPQTAEQVEQAQDQQTLTLADLRMAELVRVA
jgi:hypothetical protein